MHKKKHTRQYRQPGQQPQPRWQPIETLWTFATHIDGMLESSEEQYATLQEAKLKPHVLDNYIVNWVISAFRGSRSRWTKTNVKKRSVLSALV